MHEEELFRGGEILSEGEFKRTKLRYNAKITGHIRGGDLSVKR